AIAKAAFDVDAVAPAVELAAEPVGVPGGKRPRLMALAANSEETVALQAQVEAKLVEAGYYEPEKRAFWPHLTVARVKPEAPRGRIVEIFGPESSGKTTLIYHIVAEAQARGGVCAFIDTEHAIDPMYARKIGVNTDELLISQPDHGEQALEIVDVLVRSGAVDVVAVDSVAALTPRVELEGQMGDQHVGLQARMMSQAMRKLAGNLNRTSTLCILTNQIREKVGVMFGSPETQPGGRALKFYASQRLD